MARLAFVLVLLAVMFGAAGLVTKTDQASATPGIPDVVKTRLDLDCNQVVAPNGPNNPVPGVGVVHCTLTLDIPTKLENLFGWPDTVEYDVWAAYRDRDGNNRPSHGDRLLCIKILGPGVDIERCRPGIDIPDGLSLPSGP